MPSVAKKLEKHAKSAKGSVFFFSRKCTVHLHIFSLFDKMKKNYQIYKLLCNSVTSTSKLMYFLLSGEYFLQETNANTHTYVKYIGNLNL